MPKRVEEKRLQAEAQQLAIEGALAQDMNELLRQELHSAEAEAKRLAGDVSRARMEEAEKAKAEILQLKEDLCRAKAKQEEESCERFCAQLLRTCQAVAATVRSAFGLDKVKEAAANEILSRADLQVQFKDFCDGLLELCPLAQRMQGAVEALSGMTQCSVSLQPFQRPVLAADGHTYEKSFFKKWIKLNPDNPTSPHTREPLRPLLVFPNRAVLQALDVLRILTGAPSKEVTDDVEDPDSDAEELASPRDDSHAGGTQGLIGYELVDAIISRDEALALQLLSQPVDPAVLNGRFGENCATLLHMALINMQPAIALALLRKVDFAAAGLLYGAEESISAMHLAAALGEMEVCQVLLDCCGLHEADCMALLPIVVHFHNGEELNVGLGHTPVGMAGRYRHTEVTKLLKDARATYNAQCGRETWWR